MGVYFGAEGLGSWRKWAGLRFSVNTMQLFALVWMAIALILSAFIVFSLAFPRVFYPLMPVSIYPQSMISQPVFPWQLAVIMFFVSVLLIILPVYILLYVWHKLSES